MEKNTLSLRDKQTMPVSSRPKFRETKNPYFVWEAPEFEYREKTKDWYWVVWIIGISGMVASYMLGNYIFGLLLILITATITFLGARRPQVMQIQMNEKGLRMNEKFYPFSKMESFNINSEDYKLIIKRRSDVLPVLTIPLNPNIRLESLVTFLENFVELDEDLNEAFFDIFSEKIGL